MTPTFLWFEVPVEGIYRQDGDQAVICYRNAKLGRPTSFRTTEDQHLLTLHRVRIRK